MLYQYLNFSSTMATLILWGVCAVLTTINALPVDVQLMTTIDDSKVHNREVRSSTDGLGWHLDRIDQRQKPLDGKYCPISQGSGVDIYVFSTGIEYKHEEFGGRAFYGGYDKYGYDGSDCDGQGTAVASLAVGKIVGVAKKAKVYSIKVLKCYSSGGVDFSAVIEGMEHVINRVRFSHKRSVVALPFLGYIRHPDVNAIIRKAVNAVIRKAVDAGIVVVTGAGFHAEDACNESPANSPDVITVGSTHAKDGIIYGFFHGVNYGKCITLFAPGHYITAATISYRCLFKSTKKCYEERYGDTKEACGIVAGAAALVLEQFPRYTPEEVKQHLANKATDGAINMEWLLPRMKAKTPNKLLYIGKDDGCIEKEIPFSGSGDYNDNSDDEDLWK